MDKFNTWFWASATLSLLLGSIGGFWVKRRTDTVEKWLSDKNSHNATTTALTVAGTIIGGGLFIGIGQMGHEAGIVGLIVGLSYFVGLLLVAVLATRLRATMEVHKASDLYDLISKKYSVRLRNLYAAANVSIFILLLSAQFFAVVHVVKFLSSAFGLSEYGLIGLTGAALFSCIFYSVAGGLRRDIISDIWQVVVIGACLALIAGYGISYASVGKVLTSQPPSNMNGLGYGWVFLIGVGFFLTPSMLVRVDMWERVIASRDATSAQRGFIWGGLISLAAFLVFTYIGMEARASGIVDSETASFGWMKLVLQNSLVLGLVFGGFMSAVVSSADTFIGVAARGLYYLVGGSKNSHDLRKIRGHAVIVIACAALSAMLFRDIVNIMVASLSLLLVFLPMIIGLVNEKNVRELSRDEPAVYWAAAIGLAAFLVGLLGGLGKDAFVPSVLLTFAAFAVLRRMSSFVRG